MRLTSTTFTFVSLFAAACGDDGGSTPPVDAPARDIGFTKPTASLKANNEVSDNNWVELGPANLTCLNTPSDDVATTGPIVVNGVISDFQSGNLVPGTVVTVFKDQNIGMPEGASSTSAASTAAVSLTIPTGTKRFGYKMVNPEVALDTLLLNQTLDSPTTTPQDVGEIQSVSTQTAATLPALIGVSRTAGTGILAGAVRDCDGNEISNFIATVSSTENTVTHLDGVDTYYFSSSVGLPVRHSQQKASAKDGLFMAIEMQPTPTAYIQVWGYKDDTDLASDTLSLIAQLKTQVIADTVITGSYEPLRTN